MPQLIFCCFVFLFNHRLRASVTHLGTWNYPSFSSFQPHPGSHWILFDLSPVASLLASLTSTLNRPSVPLIWSMARASGTLLPGGGEVYGKSTGLKVRHPGLNSCLHYVLLQCLWASISSSLILHSALRWLWGPTKGWHATFLANAILPGHPLCPPNLLQHCNTGALLLLLAKPPYCLWPQTLGVQGSMSIYKMVSNLKHHSYHSGAECK